MVDAKPGLSISLSPCAGPGHAWPTASSTGSRNPCPPTTWAPMRMLASPRSRVPFAVGEILYFAEQFKGLPDAGRGERSVPGRTLARIRGDHALAQGRRIWRQGCSVTDLSRIPCGACNVSPVLRCVPNGAPMLEYIPPGSTPSHLAAQISAEWLAPIPPEAPGLRGRVGLGHHPVGGSFPARTPPHRRAETHSAALWAWSSG